MPEPQLVIHDDETVTPFWHRLPRFFLFPLRLPMLLVLAPLALATLLADFLPVPRPLDIVIVEGLVWLTALRHAFGVLERTAAGLLSPDEYDRMPPDPERVNLPWKLLGVVVVWGFTIGTLSSVSEALGLLASLFFNLAFPASVMALAVTNNLIHAANPLLWASIMGSIGRPYLALFVFLLLLSGGAAIALPLMAPLLRGPLALPLTNFAFLYFNLIMFNMMGYVLYQYHRVLGVPVKVAFAASAENTNGRRAAAEADPVAELVARKVADGDLDGALDAAYEQQRLETDDVAVQDRYHRLLLLAGKTERALDHGRRFLAMLLRTGRGDQAVALFRRLRELDPGFAPDQPGQVLPLAQAARRCREFPLALSLMRAFDKRHPRHADVPGVYLLSAQILSEHFRKDDLAAAILRGLRAKFPEHPLAGEAAAYLAVLERIHQSTA